MAIKWYNVRSKEVRTSLTPELTAAMWGSSDRGPNAKNGQDMGWRLAPEVVVELERLAETPMALERIAARYAIPYEDIKEADLLQWISDQTDEKDAPEARQEDYTEDYEAEVRRLRKKRLKEQQQKNTQSDEADPSVDEPTKE